MSAERISELNDLLGTVLDSIQGYEKALELGDDDTRLQTLFRQRLDERKVLVGAVTLSIGARGTLGNGVGGAKMLIHKRLNRINGAEPIEIGVVAAVKQPECFWLPGRVE